MITYECFLTLVEEGYIRQIEIHRFAEGPDYYFIIAETITYQRYYFTSTGRSITLFGSLSAVEEQIADVAHLVNVEYVSF